MFRHSENWKALNLGPQIVSHKQSKHQHSDPHDTITECGHSKSNPSDTLMTSSFHPSANPELFLAHLSVLSTGDAPIASMSTTSTTRTTTGISTSEGKGKEPQRTSFSMEVPKVILPPPSNPAMDFLVQETALNKSRVEWLQQSAEYIFKKLVPVKELKTATLSLKTEVAEGSQRMTRLEAAVEAQGQTLAAILAKLTEIAARPVSFTEDDRKTLSGIADAQVAQTTEINKIASDVHTTMLHVLPANNPEGERVELNEELISKTAEEPLHTHTTLAEKLNEGVNEEEEEEGEEEEEEDDDDDDDDDQPHLHVDRGDVRYN